MNGLNPQWHPAVAASGQPSTVKPVPPISGDEPVAANTPPRPSYLMQGAAIAAGAAVGASGIGYVLTGLYVLGRWCRALLAIFVLALVLVSLFPNLAPHDVNQQVDPSFLRWPSHPCADFGGISAAYLTNDVGYAGVYQVECGNGMTVMASPQP